MEEIWLGTISPPYESPLYQVAARTREGVEKILLCEAVEEWGLEIDNPEWNNSTERYAYLKNGRPSIEVRKIELYG